MIRASAILGLLILPLPLFAQVSITEVMYDLPGADSGREWVEVHNSGSTPLDLTSFKFLEGTVRHSITATGFAELPAGSFAILAENPTKFLADNPSYTGALFDSSFSLSNTGETIALVSGSSTADTVAYAKVLGAAGDGLSLSRTPSGFVAANPSPGRGFSPGDVPIPKPTSGAVATATKEPASPAPKNQEPSPQVTAEAPASSQVFEPAQRTQSSPYLWWVALVVVLTLGATTAYLVRRSPASIMGVSAEAAEYEIIE